MPSSTAQTNPPPSLCAKSNAEERMTRSRATTPTLATRASPRTERLGGLSSSSRLRSRLTTRSSLERQAPRLADAPKCHIHTAAEHESAEGLPERGCERRNARAVSQAAWRELRTWRELAWRVAFGKMGKAVAGMKKSARSAAFSVCDWHCWCARRLTWRAVPSDQAAARSPTP